MSVIITPNTGANNIALTSDTGKILITNTSGNLIKLSDAPINSFNINVNINTGINNIAVSSNTGKILVTTTGSNIINLSNIPSSSTSINNHNSLLGLQGGEVGQYYHLNSSEYLNLKTGIKNLVYTTGDQTISGLKTFNNIQFNLSGYTAGEGQLAWDATEGTISAGLLGGQTILHIGQQEFVKVVNKTNSNLLKSEFKPIRVRLKDEGGPQGNRLAVVLAQADSDLDSATTIGIVTENINNNQEGFILTKGLIQQIDTRGTHSYNGSETWEAGDTLYLSPYSAGFLTNIKPQAPQHMIIIGWVVNAHQTQGSIFVKVDNGYEIDELHNVKINNPQNNEALIYQNSLWVNTNLNQLFVLNSETGQFYPKSNPSGFITGINNLVYTTGDQILNGKLTINNQLVQTGIINIGSGTGSPYHENYIGEKSYENFIGRYCDTNEIGGYSTHNYFGELSVNNYFGEKSTNNEFGYYSTNRFGQYGKNYYYGGTGSGEFYFDTRPIVSGIGVALQNETGQFITEAYLSDYVLYDQFDSANSILQSQIDNITNNSNNIIGLSVFL